MFIYYIITALILTRVPIVGKYFRLFTTLIHEIGHAVAGIFTFGKVDYITLSPDTSGGALVRSRNFITSIIVSLAGYPFASGMSFVLIFMIHKGYYEYILYGMIGIAVVSIALWIRNLFGLVWLITAAVLTSWVLFSGNSTLIIAYATTLAAVVFVDSFMSTLELFKIIVKNRRESGDAHNLRNKTGITEYFWGMLFIAVACAPVYYSFDLWFSK